MVEYNKFCCVLTVFVYLYCLLGKLTGFQPIKKFPAFYGTRRFITAFTRARHLSLAWASSIQSIPPYPTSWRSVLILYSHLICLVFMAVIYCNKGRNLLRPTQLACNYWGGYLALIPSSGPWTANHLRYDCPVMTLTQQFMLGYYHTACLAIMNVKFIFHSTSLMIIACCNL